ncbi:hypothetical protein BD770DRAFT_378289 [Pilaira anomala]|nr:hypothetical protein BD770DRAFT_378289 [Pilaira anomala]
MNNQHMNIQQSDNMNNQQTDLNNPFIGDADNRRTDMNSNDMHHQGLNMDGGKDTMMRSQNAGVGAPHTLMDNHPIDMSGQNKGARMTNQPIGTGQQSAGMFNQPTGMHEHRNHHDILNTDRSNPTQNTNLNNNSNDNMMHNNNNLNKSNDILTTQASGHNNHHDLMNTHHLDSNKYQTTMEDTHPEKYHDALNTQPNSNRHDLMNTHHTTKMTTGDGELNRSTDLGHNHQTGTNRGTDTTNMNNQHNMGEVKTGDHPTTVEDIHRSSGNNLTQTSNPTQGLRNNNTNLTHKNNLEDSKGSVSAISSTPSEYGSSDDNNSRTSHNNRAPLTADKNAFVEPKDTKKHWQTKMSPSERAKELVKEMDDKIKHRGTTDEKEKSLKIGESKEIKLD